MRISENGNSTQSLLDGPNPEARLAYPDLDTLRLAEVLPTWACRSEDQSVDPIQREYEVSLGPGRPAAALLGRNFAVSGPAPGGAKSRI